jgi:predicted nucleotidyltransferase
MKYVLNDSGKEKIFEDISLALNRHKEIVLAYIFGSFVQSDTFSDIDLAVLTDRELEAPLDFELKLEIELEDVVHYPVDVRILNRAPLSFCQNVIRYGRVILERDANLHADFMGKILKQYFDFSPYRRRYLSEVINAPI